MAVDLPLAQQQAQGAWPAQAELAEVVITPVQGPDVIQPLPGFPPADLPGEDALIDLKGFWSLVADLKVHLTRGTLADLQADRIFGAQGKTGFVNPLD